MSSKLDTQIAAFFAGGVGLIGLGAYMLHPAVAFVWLGIVSFGLAWGCTMASKDEEKSGNSPKDDRTATG